MAKNWTAYEAAKAIYGENKNDIAEVGSRYPLFTRTVAMLNSEYVLDILKALSKVTARVVETGLNNMDDAKEIEPECEEMNEVVEDSDLDYSTMKSTELYKLCCDRGISSYCTKRTKAALIKILEDYDEGKYEGKTTIKNDTDSVGKKKRKTKEVAEEKVAESDEQTDDDWDVEEEEAKDPYDGKTAKELYEMCKERGIDTKPRQKANAYVELLKKADTTESESDDEDDDDDWEI